MIYVIGCGGVGSWLAASLVKLRPDVTLIDGDRFEEKNLDRQLFLPTDVGKNKAMALSSLHGTAHIPQYYSSGLFRAKSGDVLLCCADNHACRQEVLAACDLYRCKAVIGANEYTDAEAYWYEPEYKDTTNDPRVFYPSILTDRSGDPTAPAGCVEAARESPQLVLANYWASGMILHLFYFHTVTRKGLSKETEPNWPVHELVSAMRQFTIKHGDKGETA